MKKHIERILFYCFAVLIISIGSGCVAIRGKQLSSSEPLSVKSQVPLASIAVSVECTFNGRDARMSKRAQEKHLAAVKKVLKESGAFQEIITGISANNVHTDYRLKYKVDETGNAALAVISGFISGYTLFIIPGGSVAHHSVTASLENRFGNPLGEKVYTDKITMVMWLPLLPAMLFEEHNFFTASEAYFMNMYRHSLLDLLPKHVEAGMSEQEKEQYNGFN